MGFFSLSGSAVSEGTSSADPNYLDWTISRNGDLSTTDTVSFRFLSGTALAGSDAYGRDGTVSFAPGETTQTVRYRIDADAVDEPDETIMLEVFNPTGGGRLPGNVPVLRSTAWILDDDGGTQPALFVSRPLIVEGDGGSEAQFELSLSRPATGPLELTYRTVDGTARAGEDYTAREGTVAFVTGQTTASVSVEIIDDTEIEDSESFTLAVDAVTGLETVSLGAGRILDDDGALPTLSIAGSVAPEGTSSADPFYLTWTASLDAPAEGPVSLGYRFLSGSAEAGSDAYGRDGSVTFAAGETSKTISYRIDADAVNEPDETIVLEAFDPSGAALAGGAPVLRAAAWILDDDGGTQASLFAAPPVLVEGDDGQTLAQFELSLSRPAAGAFSLDYETVPGSARPGEDYEPVSGSIDFVRGQTTAAVSVPVLGDAAVEPSEMFTLALTGATALEAVSPGAAFVLDDDAGTPTVSLAGSAAPEGTSSADPFYLTWTVSLDAPAEGPVSLGYRFLSGSAEAGSDAYGRDGTVEFAPGETSKQVSYRIDGDAVDEFDEAIVLELSSAEGAALAGGALALRAPGWIRDDDGGSGDIALFTTAADVVEADPDEPAPTVLFEISLSRPAPEAFTATYATVDGTARAGSDYEASSGEIAFAQGQTTAAVRVPVLNDERVEGAESFGLSIGLPPGIAIHIAALGQATILEDDLSQPPVAADDSYQIVAGETRNVPEGSGVLENDSDPEGGALTVRLVSDVSDGTLVLSANGGFTYVPDTGFTGTDSFTYVASDGDEDSPAATVTLAVGRRRPTEEDDDLEGGPEADEVALLGGDDSYSGLGGKDTVSGGAGRDSIDGGSDDDRLFGDGGADTLLGATGNDWLAGGNGDDSLSGGDGNDTLIGGDGEDGLAGGAGRDAFAFLAGPGTGVDRVTDFGDRDIFALDDRYFEAFAGDDIAPRAVTRAQAQAALQLGKVAYDGGSGEFFVDGEVIAVLEGGPRLTYEDVFLF